MRLSRLSRTLNATMAAVLTAAFAVLPGAATSPAVAAIKPGFTANVMAPLLVNDWGTFESQLQAVKNYGVDAVSVDVWWGKVEGAADNQFDWSYYDTLFQKITAKGLDIVPIFSFHQCGGNVGDTCNIPLPPWLWSKYTGRTVDGIVIDANGLKHQSEQGNFSAETVQGWADSLVANEYTDFTSAFVSRYGATYPKAFQEINVSLGPAGELRYPSYNSHDTGTGYPTRGALQAYSPLAVASFQQWAIAKYGSVSAVNAAWGSSVTSAAQIRPPSNPGPFFSSGDYRTIRYGKDLIDWYNASLVSHGERMLTTVSQALGTAFPTAKLGYKIPGIHWSMTGPTPRAAEVASGIVQTSVDMNAASTGHGYANIVGLAQRIPGRDVVLHFTALEMNDENYSPQYSQAKTLVGWVGAEAARQGVTIKGENALSGGATSDGGWNNITNAFDTSAYSGMTVLRVGEVASGTGANRYAQFIYQYRGSNTSTGGQGGSGGATHSGWPSLYIRGTNNNWATTPMTKTGDVWSAQVTFGATSSERFKFDVKGDWAQNYGGTGLTGIGVPGGADVAVAAGGTYTITFTESTKAYTVSLVSSGGGTTPTPQGVTIHFAEWQSAQSYSVHTWNGLNGTFPMTYEGYLNNRHWWKVTLSNAPASFGLTFTNSNGNWDQPDRFYNAQAQEIYLKSGDATIYTNRPG